MNLVDVGEEDLPFKIPDLKSLFPVLNIVTAVIVLRAAPPFQRIYENARRTRSAETTTPTITAIKGLPVLFEEIPLPLPLPLLFVEGGSEPVLGSVVSVVVVDVEEEEEGDDDETDVFGNSKLKCVKGVSGPTRQDEPFDTWKKNMLSFPIAVVSDISLVNCERLTLSGSVTDVTITGNLASATSGEPLNAFGAQKSDCAVPERSALKMDTVNESPTLGLKKLTG